MRYVLDTNTCIYALTLQGRVVERMREHLPSEIAITTITLAELSPRELGQGSGLYNFFRQLGGSLGIAAIATLLSHYTAQFRAILSEHISIGDPTTISRLEMLTRALVARGADPWTARERALEILDRQLMAQASVIAYSRIYVLSAMLILALIPLLVLVRHKRGAAVVKHILE